MKLTKQEKTAIYWLHYMQYNYPKSLAEHMDITMKEAEKMIRDLEDKGFISVEERDGEIYGSKLTPKGLKFWESFIEEDPLAEDLGY